MPVPNIATLRNQAKNLIESQTDSTVQAVLAGAVASVNAGSVLAPGQSLQDLVNETKGLQYSAPSDVSAILVDQWMRLLQALAPTGSVALAGYPGAVALRTRTVLGAYQLAYLLWASAQGDNGGGWFWYDATSTATDDGVDVVKPDSVDVADPGRWLRNS